MKQTYVIAGIVIAVGIILWASTRASCRPPAMWEGMANGDRDGGAASVVVLAAPSWCGWSKKMAAQVPALSSGLRESGVSVRMVDDKSEEGKQLSSKHGVNGYPATLVFGSDGEKKGQVGGFKPVDDLIKEIKALL
jgi:thiol-disulfide isomerase/thioredoxin